MPSPPRPGSALGGGRELLLISGLGVADALLSAFVALFSPLVTFHYPVSRYSNPPL